jgi:G3E family GTPase
MGFLKGQFQSLKGLQQQINCEKDLMLALAWVRTCLIIHSLAAQFEVVEEEDDFWDWIHLGLDEQEDPVEEVNGFIWSHQQQHVVGESEGQQKRQLIQEALFDALY